VEDGPELVAKRKLLAVERQQRILERVANEGALEYARLADDLGVSVMTIRRDLKELVDQGYVTVSRGGASAYLSRNLDMVENPRTHAQADEKIQIGAFAVRQIQPGEIIFLGSGSTTGAFVQFVPPDAGIHVVTAALTHASQLAMRGISVTCIGGSVIPAELTTSGPMAVDAIDRFHATTAIFGAAGISSETGITEDRMELSELSRAMLQRSARSMVLLDSKKVGLQAAYRIGRIHDVDQILTSQTGYEMMCAEVGDAAQVIAASAGTPIDPR
jgi:DeoR/GlpR family transcriptional regulator of sugar metabolism